ncbi:MAG: hypothetical protein ACRDFX_03165 [Chloroflexota bacterium]
MRSPDESYETSRQLVGQTISRVGYLSLQYDGFEDRWDFGGWHFPDIAVEFESATGELFHAVFDSQVTCFDLAFSRGRAGDDWNTPPDDPGQFRLRDVTDHPRWQTFIGSPITGATFSTVEPYNDYEGAPIALRLATSGACVWFVAAEPTFEGEGPQPVNPLPHDIRLAADQVSVLFGDQRAAALGLFAENPGRYRAVMPWGTRFGTIRGPKEMLMRRARIFLWETHDHANIFLTSISAVQSNEAQASVKAYRLAVAMVTHQP